MDEKDINNLIEKKILDAKLDIADKRFNYLVLIAGGLLAIFGIIVPIWQASTSTEKVDKVLEEMKAELKTITEKNDKQMDKYEKIIESFSQDAKLQFKEVVESQNNFNNSSNKKIEKEIESLDIKFKELAGTQLRKPNVICMYNGKSIDNILFQFDNRSNSVTLEFKNIGDAPAKNIYARVYLNTDKNVDVYGEFSSQYFSDEPTYNRAYEFRSAYSSIDPKDSRPIDFSIGTELKEEIIIPALLKIYYEQPEPIKYNFSIKVNFK